MTDIRSVPDHLLTAAMGGRTPRVIAYRAAAWLHHLDGIDALEPEFAIPHGTWRRGPFDHQRRRIEDLELVELDGMLVTSVRQTLLDLCAVVDLDIVERAAESALRMQLVDEMALRDFAYVHGFSRHGRPGLRALLDRRPVGAHATGSDLETRYVQVIRRGRLPAPVRQYTVLDDAGLWVATVDFGFLPTPFVVETDGLATHTTRDQQQHDLNRQNRISDAGYTFRRFTYDDVTRRPGYVCRETLRSLTAASRTSGMR
jgi:very-short-patch-repair endonuclease